MICIWHTNRYMEWFVGPRTALSNWLWLVRSDQRKVTGTQEPQEKLKRAGPIRDDFWTSKLRPFRAIFRLGGKGFLRTSLVLFSSPKGGSKRAAPLTVPYHHRGRQQRQNNNNVWHLCSYCLMCDIKLTSNIINSYFNFYLFVYPSLCLLNI